jgi:2-iminoacetate synthase
MPFTVDKTRLSQSGYDFIDEPYLHALIEQPADAAEVRDIIAKSLAKQPLSVEETALLLAAEDPESVEMIFDAARRLKREVYGRRIVIFAPLYVGNECTNDCAYCAFRRSNTQVVRRTLGEEDIARQVAALESRGHKRLILVFGEHPDYDAQFMAECVQHVYAVRTGRGEIRRVSINAAPLDHRGYQILHDAQIAVYQIFQETYHHDTYQRVHPPCTRKADYLWRLDGLARAMEADLGDVGIGALFGLYDWRFEALGLIAHARHLQKHYGVGPHTISFPRLRPASGVQFDEAHFVSDADFQRLVAVLRLAAPYAGLVLTAREPPEVRRKVLEFGVSQIDAGSRIELGGYTECGDAQVMEREQFQLGDIRPLDAVLHELLVDGYIPSFCTTCYRVGRTGGHFMELAIPGFIQNYCTPNALTTLLEYLLDYAPPETRAAGEAVIARELENLPDGPRKTLLLDRLRRTREKNERDLHA